MSKKMPSVGASLSLSLALLAAVAGAGSAQQQQQAPRKPLTPPKTPAAAAPAAAVAAAKALAPGTAKGTLTVGTRTFALTRAYAQMEDDAEGPMPDGRKRNLVVLLADTEVSPDDAADFFRCALLAREGKLHGVMLQIDPDTKQMYLVQIMYVEGEKSGSPPNISLIGKGLNHRLTGLSLGTEAISAVAEMQKPDTWTDFAEDAPKRSYQYRAAFNAPIRQPLPVTATLTGQAAKDSPQVTAAAALFAAARAADMEAVRRLSTPNPQMEAAYKEAGPEKFKEMAKEMTPDPAQFKKDVRKVIVRADRKTTILFGDGNAMRLVREGDGWKVTN